MRYLAKLALALSLLAPTIAIAEPSPPTERNRRALSRYWLGECLAERTGPTGGISESEARAICTAENPYASRKPDAPAVTKAKADIARAKHALRIAKAVARATKAIEQCEEAVLVACEDTTERSVDRGECDAAALKTELAQCSAGSR